MAPVSLRKKLDFIDLITSEQQLKSPLLGIFKPRVPVDECQVHFADRSVSLLSDDHLGLSPLAAQAFPVVGAFTLVIDLIPIDK